MWNSSWARNVLTFRLEFDFHVILEIFYMLQICDMGQTALLLLRRKACWGFFLPLKIPRLRPGLNPRTWVPKASTLLLDHRSRCLCDMWNNIVEPDRPQITIWHMHITCWKPKATNTLLEYAIVIAFPPQQWLHECASSFRYLYTACLV
jgi:hypothetical protein